jgi:predicted metal-binding membrane protein
MLMTATALETVLRRDRLIVAASLVAVTALAWLYVLQLAAGMDMGGMDMTGFRMISTGFEMAMAPAQEPWSTADFVMMFAMWAVMMVGMMTPSAAPMILIYARVGRMAATAGRPVAAAAWFVAGYLLLWVGFALAATTAQWALERFALLDPAMATASTMLGGGVLIAAGLYQWTPLKYACLSECQSPLLFIQRHGGFRGDALGALRLGSEHGISCIGCCWALMVLLFVGGVMNVLWIAALTIFALVEKISPAGRLVSRVAGLVLIAAGVRLIVT